MKSHFFILSAILITLLYTLDTQCRSFLQIAATTVDATVACGSIASFIRWVKPGIEFFSEHGLAPVTASLDYHPPFVALSSSAVPRAALDALTALNMLASFHRKGIKNYSVPRHSAPIRISMAISCVGSLISLTFLFLEWRLGIRGKIISSYMPRAILDILTVIATGAHAFRR